MLSLAVTVVNVMVGFHVGFTMFDVIEVLEMERKCSNDTDCGFLTQKPFRTQKPVAQSAQLGNCAG